MYSSMVNQIGLREVILPLYRGSPPFGGPVINGFDSIKSGGTGNEAKYNRLVSFHILPSWLVLILKLLSVHVLLSL